MHRRQWLKAIASVGVGSSVFQRALAAEAVGSAEVTAEMVRQAKWVAGVELSPEEEESLAAALGRRQESWVALRKVPLDPFRDPVTASRLPEQLPSEPSGARAEKSGVAPDDGSAALLAAKVAVPDSPEALAHLSVWELASLLRQRRVTSLQLTRLYLERLQRFDPLLHCVVHLTEDLALRQAEEADRELSRGQWRGPLHGIPWGAKDLISVPGYPTTWGVPQFAQRTLDQAATVYQRLTEAGAVLVAKLSLGALAMGDRWHGGMTRNPWNPEQGSSGSSAGSAAAVAAGLVGFAIGSETLGSILSPSRVCGNTGLRPTFGLVSRFGCMPLSWSMDKLGPMARTARDAALVLQAIAGWDSQDASTTARPWDVFPERDPSRIRIGYIRNPRRGDDDAAAEDRSDLRPFRELGFQLVEVQLPDSIPARAMTAILEVEGASVFESWLNAGQIEGWNSWPGIFRAAQFVTAVDYLRAQRLRGVLMEQMEALFGQVDLLVNANDLVITNLTGHPSISFTDRMATRDGRDLPRPCVLTGRWYEDGLVAAVAWQVQRHLGLWGRRPPLETFLAERHENEGDDVDDDRRDDG